MEGEEIVHVDWSAQLNPPPTVWNQLRTETCVAFAFTEASKYKMHIVDRHRYLSPQYLLDWAPTDWTPKDPPEKLQFKTSKMKKYLATNGICEEAEYRKLDLKRQQSEQCKGQLHKVVFEKMRNNKRLMIHVVKSAGPFVARVYITAKLRLWKMKNEEVLIMDPPNQLELEKPHAVVVVGYGERFQDGLWLEYLKIHNSWGKDFGKDGYGKICIGISTSGSRKYENIDAYKDNKIEFEFSPLKAVARPVRIEPAISAAPVVPSAPKEAELEKRKGGSVSMGMENPDSVTREDDLVDALDEVNEGIIPENQLVVGEEMSQWSNLEVEPTKEKRRKSAKPTDTTAADIEDEDDEKDMQKPTKKKPRKSVYATDTTAAADIEEEDDDDTSDEKDMPAAVLG